MIKYYKWKMSFNESQVDVIGISTAQLKDEKGEDKSFLSKLELKKFEALSSRKRKNEYFVGRNACKQLLLDYLDLGNLKADDISVVNSKNGIPIILPDQINLSVSITHSGRYLSCLLFSSDLKFGIDMEDLSNIKESIKYATLATEMKLYEKGMDIMFFYTMILVSKEALGKALKIGISQGINKYEISNIKKKPIYCQVQELSGIYYILC